MFYEDWRKMKGYIKDYEVSNFGRVRYQMEHNKRNIIITRAKNNLRCLLINSLGRRVCKNVAELVLQHFDKPQEKGVVVGYVDGDKYNCRLENLYWKLRCGLVEDEVVEIREQYRNDISIKKLSERYEVNEKIIKRIVRHEVWPGVGFQDNIVATIQLRHVPGMIMTSVEGGVL